jgi:hypothetical protein
VNSVNNNEIGMRTMEKSKNDVGSTQRMERGKGVGGRVMEGMARLDREQIIWDKPAISTPVISNNCNSSSIHHVPIPLVCVCLL